MKPNPMQKHETFILDTLLPIVAAHARAIGASSEESAMAAFLALGTVLQSKGFSDSDLLTAIKVSRLGVHAQPEGMQ